jgi:hypothetical protein
MQVSLAYYALVAEVEEVAEALQLLLQQVVVVKEEVAVVLQNYIYKLVFSLLSYIVFLEWGVQAGQDKYRAELQPLQVPTGLEAV